MTDRVLLGNNNVPSGTLFSPIPHTGAGSINFDIRASGMTLQSNIPDSGTVSIRSGGNWYTYDYGFYSVSGALSTFIQEISNPFSPPPVTHLAGDKVVVGSKRTEGTGIWVSKPTANVLAMSDITIPEDDWYGFQEEFDWVAEDGEWANSSPGVNRPYIPEGWPEGEQQASPFGFCTMALYGNAPGFANPVEWQVAFDSRGKLKRTTNNTILYTGGYEKQRLFAPVFVSANASQSAGGYAYWWRPYSGDIHPDAIFPPDYPVIEMRIRRLSTPNYPEANPHHHDCKLSWSRNTLNAQDGATGANFPGTSGASYMAPNKIDSQPFNITQPGYTDIFPHGEISGGTPGPWKILEWDLSTHADWGGIADGQYRLHHASFYLTTANSGLTGTGSTGAAWNPETDPMWEIDYVRVKKASIPAGLGRWNSKQASLLLDSDVFSQGLVHQSGIVTIGTAKALINGNTSNRVVGHNIDNDANGYVSFPELDYIPLVLFQRIEEGVVGKSYPGGEDEFSVCTQNWADKRSGTIDTTNPYHLTHGSSIKTVGKRKAEDIFQQGTHQAPWPSFAASTRWKVTWNADSDPDSPTYGESKGELISKASKARTVLGVWNYGGGMNYPMYPNFYSYTSLGDNEAVYGDGTGTSDFGPNYAGPHGATGDWEWEVGFIWGHSVQDTYSDPRIGGDGYFWRQDPERRASTELPSRMLRDEDYSGVYWFQYPYRDVGGVVPDQTMAGWNSRPWWGYLYQFPNAKGNVPANQDPETGVFHDNPHLLDGSTPLHTWSDYMAGSADPVVRAEAFSVGFENMAGSTIQGSSQPAIFRPRFDWEDERWKPRRYFSYLPTNYNPGVLSPNIGSGTGSRPGPHINVHATAVGSYWGPPAPFGGVGNDYSGSESFQEVRTFAYARAKKDGFWLTCRNAIGQEGLEPALNLAPVLPEEGTANQGSAAFTNMRSNNDNGAWGMFHPALTLYDTGDGNGPQKFTEGLQLKWDTRTTANLALLDKVGTDRYGRTYDQYKWWPSFSCSGLAFNGVLARPSGNTPMAKWDWPISYEPSLGNPAVVYQGEAFTVGGFAQGGDEPILMGSTDSVTDSGSERPGLVFPIYDAEYTVNGILKGDTGGFYPHRYQSNRVIHIDDKGVVFSFFPATTGERRSKHTFYQYNFKRLSSPGIFHPENVVPEATESFNNRNVPSSGDTIENQTAYIGGAMNKKTGSVASYDKTKVNAPKYRYWVMRIPVSIPEYTS